MDFTKTEYKSLNMFCKNIKLIHNKKKRKSILHLLGKNVVSTVIVLILGNIVCVPVAGYK